MSDSYRHHHAPRPAVIFVEVPAAGSPKTVREVKPRYPDQDRTPPWRPQRAIPAKRGKAAALVRLMRELAEREAAAREMLKPDPKTLKVWLSGDLSFLSA